MYSDAHIHISEDMINIMKEKPIQAILSCTNAIQCKEANSLCLQYPDLKVSCGVHPWNADSITFEEMKEWMDTYDIIGEIGMDNVWCDVSIEQQVALFIKQVKYAYHQQKPVILHTKGQEETIAKIIQNYPNTYLVHWYSCMEYLDLYKEMDCYFSVGPDLKDPAVRQVVKEIDLHHLLIESDGVNAIAWAKECDVKDVDYFRTMDETATYIAKEKQVDEKNIWKIVNDNLFRFMNSK